MVLKRIQKLFLLLGTDISAKHYVALSLITSFACFIFIRNVLSLSAAVAVCAIVFCILLFLPYYAFQRYLRKAESEIPWVALSVAASLDSGMNIDDALRLVSSERYIGKIFKYALDLYDRGIPLERALKKASEQYPSERVKRLFFHLSSLCTLGGDTDVLYKTADDLLRVQQLDAKRCASQLVVVSLLFIAVSSLIPSLFEIYVGVGSSFVEISLSPHQVFTMIAFFFPAVTFVVLLWAYSRIPEVVR